MKYKKMIFILLGTSLIVGCSSNGYHMRINSTPSSAKVYCGGTYMGETPDVHIYDKRINPDIHKEYLTDCVVKWPSGATKEVGTIPVNKRGGTRIQVDRPTDAPNLELDYQVDYQRQTLRNQQRIINQNQQMIYKMNQSRQTNTRCSSDGFGNTYCNSTSY